MMMADCVLYNEAKSGIYIQNMIKQLGIEKQVKNKTKRYLSAEALMERVGAGPLAKEPCPGRPIVRLWRLYF